MVVTDDNTLQFPEYNFSLKKDIITINRDGNDGLGFTILGGIDYPYFPGHSGIFIASIRPNTVVKRDNRLKAGDLIHSVNGESLRNIKHSNAVKILRNLKPGPVVFEVTFNAEKCIIVQLKETVYPGKGVLKNTTSISTKILCKNSASSSYINNNMTTVIGNQNTEHLFHYQPTYENDEGEDTGISDTETDSTSLKYNYTPYSRHRFISSSSSIYGKNYSKSSAMPHEIMNLDDDDMLERASTVSYAPSVAGNFQEEDCITNTETPKRRIRFFSINDLEAETDGDIIPYSEYVAAVVGVGAVVVIGVLAYKYLYKH
uniref:PDZ domain-containing protein n=1 Tax=Parastrongyloides trichosuri TaxID=131310 RepID=A0A0N4Z3J8_PARTI